MTVPLLLLGAVVVLLVMRGGGRVDDVTTRPPGKTPGKKRHPGEKVLGDAKAWEETAKGFWELGKEVVSTARGSSQTGSSEEV